MIFRRDGWIHRRDDIRSARQESLRNCFMTQMGRYMASQTTDILRKHFGADFPSVYDLLGQSPLVFVNAVEILDFTRPVLHKIVYIGGIGMVKPKPLSKVS